MEVIIIESKAFNELLKKIEESIELTVDEKFKKIAELIERNDRERSKQAAVDSTIQQLQSMYLAPKEACAILKCSIRTLHTYREQGLISYIKKGGKVWYTMEDIKSFLEHQKIG